HYREYSAERLRPVRQRSVQQVVRPCPDVDEDERPEVDDGQFIGIDRPVGGLGQEVVHQAQVGGGQEESHGIVPVPPLDEGILYAGENRIALPEAYRQFEVVADVEHGHRYPGGDVKPDRYVEVLLAAL